jgi:hypothetical protein
MQLDKLTFVIQGPIYFNDKINRTHQLIEEIISYFPNNQVIFSTWEGGNLSIKSENLKIIKSKDPGSNKKVGRYTSNFKRQLISTLCGIKEVQTEYLVKLRSDTALNFRSFKKFLTNLKPTKKICLFYESTPIQLFMIDDKVMLGPKAELEKLWFIPDFIENEEKFIKDLEAPFQNIKHYIFERVNNLNVSPEQILFLNYISIKSNPLKNSYSLLGLSRFYVKEWPIYFKGYCKEIAGINSYKNPIPKKSVLIKLYIQLLGFKSGYFFKALILTIKIRLKSPN